MLCNKKVIIYQKDFRMHMSCLNIHIRDQNFHSAIEQKSEPDRLERSINVE